MSPTHRSLSILSLSMIAALAACGGGVSSSSSSGGTTSNGGSTASGGAGGSGCTNSMTAGCRSSDTCSPDEVCLGPQDNHCGTSVGAMCFGDDDCAGDVCHSISNMCGGLASYCAPSCADGTFCQGGFRCGASGSCEPIPCDQPGGACVPSDKCDTSSIDPNAAPPDRSDGCRHIACKCDGDCPASAFCVNGYCQTDVGQCQSPPA